MRGKELHSARQIRKRLTEKTWKSLLPTQELFPLVRCEEEGQFARRACTDARSHFGNDELASAYQEATEPATKRLQRHPQHQLFETPNKIWQEMNQHSHG